MSAAGRSKVISRLLQHPGRGGCGVGAIVDFNGPSHEVVQWALRGMHNMEHRGGVLSGSGDGAGLLMRTPRAFFEPFLAPGRRLAPEDHLSVGVIFFPPGEPENVPPTQKQINASLRREGFAPLGWRPVPVHDEVLGERARRSRKDIWQVFIGDGMVPAKERDLALFKVKARLEHRFRDLYVASFGAHTVLYKAMTTADQFAGYFPDLSSPALQTDACVLHRRYSTNIVSNWYLAQPFRVTAHNGEMNAIRAAREAVRDLEAALKLPGVLMHQGSDSADLDRMLELLTAHGVPLLEAVVRIVSPAWADRPGSGEAICRWQQAVRRAMGSLVAWEGPAAIVATDGTSVVGVLDRMGQLPLRYIVTDRGRVVLASEAGAVPVPPESIVETGSLGPGEALAVDVVAKELIRPDAVAGVLLERSGLNHAELATRHLVALPSARAERETTAADVRHLVLYGWSQQRLDAARFMGQHGREPLTAVSSEGTSACFSLARPPLCRYFSQFLGVVTNPPTDPVREGGAVSLQVFLGRSPTVSTDGPDYRPYPQYRLESPFLSTAQMHVLWRGGGDRPQATALDATYRVPPDGRSDAKLLPARIRKLVRRAIRIVGRKEASILVLSDRRAVDTLGPGVLPERLPLPMLLLASALHDALNEEGLRRRVSIVAESGEVQDAHDAAVLIANGVDAVCPWLFLQVCVAAPRGSSAADDPVLLGLSALGAGLSRIMSKMGVTTAQAYRGSHLFEAVAVSPLLVDHYLPGTVSRLGGIDLDGLHDDAVYRAQVAAREDLTELPAAPATPIYGPEVWHALQTAARGDDNAWDRFVSLVEQAPPAYLRDLLVFRPDGQAEGPALALQPIAEEEVAPPEWIVATTFRGAAMSHGALHPVAHRAIAAAFNNFGARSNSGEGGEDERRDRGGQWQHDRSRIRQVGAGRFGVEARYLVNADELEIKIGQGAKPGESGALSGDQVTAEIATIRKARQGVALTPPPSNQDIYAIEDLAQLIYNLRQINPRATIGVKLPAVTDIGTIAVGVAKAGADVLTISGFDGGSGAAAGTATAHIGLPLERALAETHQALVINGIRDSVVLRAEGGVKTGHDVVKVLAIGANEVTLGAALLVAEQCTFCRGCAKGDCPPAGLVPEGSGVGASTCGHGAAVGADAGKAPNGAARPVMALDARHDPDEDPEQRYHDARRAVERYLLALAGDVRRRLAHLGMRTPSELVGRVGLLAQTKVNDARIDKIDLSELLVDPRAFADGSAEPQPTAFRHRTDAHDLPGDRVAPSVLNRRILQAVRERLHAARAMARSSQSAQADVAERQGGGVDIGLESTSADRAVAATLAGEVAAGRVPVPAAGIVVRLRGAVGQAFGFGLVGGLTLVLEGYGNDTVGAAMSGGRIVIRCPQGSSGRPESPSLAGNAVGFGATGGEIFIGGRCGQRLAVRCSGATVVCEGAGKYAFEFMTDGTGVLLGPAGGQVACGMSGGVVYMLDREGDARERVCCDARLEPLAQSDKERLRPLLGEFASCVGSRIAEQLLAQWESEQDRFVKVTAGS